MEDWSVDQVAAFVRDLKDCGYVADQVQEDWIDGDTLAALIDSDTLGASLSVQPLHAGRIKGAVNRLKRQRCASAMAATAAAQEARPARAMGLPSI